MAMVVAGFSGGEAEELRRAMGFKRSEKRMREIETKLRAGMARNGISPEAQEQIVLSITSFALYGFPESHAASFALIAYASAYLKCHYLAAFTAALLNNQPMGFYSPATIVKDAQRHGLKVLPVDVTKSEWNCTLEQAAERTVVGRWSSVVGPPRNDRESWKHWHSSEGAEEYSPGREPWVSAELEQAPEGRKNFWSRQDDSVREQARADALEHQPCQGRASLAQHGSAGEECPHGSESRRDGPIALRLGLRYVRSLHEEAGQVIVQERSKAPFTSIQDLARRVPTLNRKELNTLAEIGALNSIGGSPQRHRGTEKTLHKDSCACSDVSVSLRLCGEKSLHRRDALWSAGAAAKASGPLLENISVPDYQSPLKKMNDEERLVADFRGTGMTVGPHPMAYHRSRMEKIGVRRAIELANLPSGRRVRTAGCVIARQRPGTAKGFVFLSLEDETGVSNAIITPDLFQKNRLLLATEQFLMIEGILQNQDGVISVKAARVSPLHVTRVQTVSHDFH
jgi:error-prone DNA polymerase